MKDEIWRDVNGYEGLYEVSNLGRVRSLNYNKTGEIRMLIVQKHRCGYLQVGLWKDGKHKTCTVHRLVAEAFIPNPDNLPEVNHINEDKQSNIVTNLEWCNAAYNSNYGTRNERISNRVYQYTKSGAFVRSYYSTREVERQTGIHHTRISACCLGRYKTSHGYIWSFNPPTPSTTRVLW